MRRAALLALLALASQAGAIPFNVYGRVFKADGTSGTAADHPSFGRAVVFKVGVPGEQALHPDSVVEASISDAGGGNPAYFLYDAGSQLAGGVAEGMTLVALVETRPGLFGWSGGAFVYSDYHVVPLGDITGSLSIFANGAQQPLPALSATAATLSSISLQWSAPSDPQGRISSYTLYRATYAPAAPEYRFGVAERLSVVAGSTAYVDAGLSAGTTYYYTLTLNYSFGAPAIGLGAEPTADYYTLFGQSAALAAATLAGSPTITPTWSASPSPSPSSTATPSDSPSATSTASPTPSASETPTVSSTFSPTATFTSSPSLTATLTATPTASSSVTASPSPTSSATSTPTASPAASPSSTATPGPAASATPSPTSAPAPDLGRVRFGPVPLRAGARGRLHFDRLPESAEWRLYNVAGERVAYGSCGAEALPGLETAGLAPGVYLLRGSASYPAGARLDFEQKLVLLP